MENKTAVRPADREEIIRKAMIVRTDMIMFKWFAEGKIDRYFRTHNAKDSAFEIDGTTYKSHIYIDKSNADAWAMEFKPYINGREVESMSDLDEFWHRIMCRSNGVIPKVTWSSQPQTA